MTPESDGSKFLFQLLRICTRIELKKIEPNICGNQDYVNPVPSTGTTEIVLKGEVVFAGVDNDTR